MRQPLDRARLRRTQRPATAGQASIGPLLGLAVLLLTLAVGYLTAHGRGLVLMALLVGLPALVAALWAFEQLVLAIAPVALLISVSLPTGTESRVAAVMLLVLLLCGVWLLSALLRPGSVRLTPSPLNAPLLCFIAVCLISLVWSIAFRDPLVHAPGKFLAVQLGACAAMVLSPVATLLIANFVRSIKRLRWVALSFVVACALWAICLALRLQRPEINTRGLFTLWFSAVGYAMLISLPRLPLWSRIGLGLLLLLHLYERTVIGIAWLSGWVPALVALVVITALWSWRACLALLLVLGLVVVTQQRFIQQHIFEEAEQDGSYERLTLWELSLELISEHPLVGTGPAGYAVYYLTYHPEEARSTHNNYLDIVAQLGLIGSLCWLWLVLAALRETRAVLRHAPPGWPRALGLASAGGLVGAVVAMALGDWVLPFAYNQGIEGYRYTVFSWIFLGVLISLRQLVAPADQPARRPSRSLAERRARAARAAIRPIGGGRG